MNINIICPNCKRKMSIIENKAQCDCCGYSYTLNTKVVTDKKLNHRLKTQIPLLIIILTILFLGKDFIISLMTDYIEDPFIGIDIDFYGVNGEGTAYINIADKSKDIKYSLSNSSGLSEGDVITLNATSSSYKLGIYEKKYTVYGLDKYITSINDIDENIRKYIHDKSYEYLKSRIENGYSFSGTIESLEPYKIYLITNGDNKNYLYDVYNLKIKTKSGNIYEKYVVANYIDVIKLTNIEKLIKYKNIGQIGKSIEAGDPKVTDVENNNYAGVITGFLTNDELDMYIKTHMETNMELYQE